MKQATKNLITTVAGLLVLGAGLCLVKIVAEPQGVMRALPYVCIGLGCGVFGHGMGDMISRKAISTDPNKAKEIEIAQKDERNIAISNRAKAKAFDLMTFVFGALMITFALMGVNTIAVLLLVFAYLLVEGYSIYYRCKYEKEM